MNAHSRHVVPPDPVSAGDTDCVPPCTMVTAAKRSATSPSATQLARGDVYSPYTQDDQDALVINEAIFFIHPSLLTANARAQMVPDSSDSDTNIEVTRAEAEGDYIRMFFRNNGRFWNNSFGCNKFVIRIVADMFEMGVIQFLNSVLHEHGCAAGSGDWPETYVRDSPEDPDNHEYDGDGDYNGSNAYQQTELATRHVIKRCLEVLAQDARDRQVIVTGDIL